MIQTLRGERTVMMAAPEIIAFECEYFIEPIDLATQDK